MPVRKVRLTILQADCEHKIGSIGGEFDRFRVSGGKNHQELDFKQAILSFIQLRTVQSKRIRVGGWEIGTEQLDSHTYRVGQDCNIPSQPLFLL